MNKLTYITSLLILTFTSCDLKEEVENAINGNIPPVEQEVSEDFTIEAINSAAPGAFTETITIDTTDINNEIDDATDSETVSIEEITIDDLEISLAEDSEQENFDFLDSLVINIYTDNIDEAVEIDFGAIPAGVNTLSLPEGASTNILSLIEGSDVDDLSIDLELITNTTIENNLDLELISSLLAQLAVEL